MITPETPLVLGSGSPRRRAILSELGLPIRVVTGDASEQLLPGESATDYVSRIARAKLEAVARCLPPEPFGAVLVADTIVVVDGEVLGKPTDTDDAVRLLRRLTGRSHVVITRYAISRAEQPEQPACERSVQSEVSMRPASDAELRAYARTGEGLDKAGAYAAQGIGAFLVERIVGSYTNVVGLPACEVILDLRRLGLLRQFP